MIRELAVGVAFSGIVLTACAGEEPKSPHVTGLYSRYEGAEYQSALVLCSTGEVWDVKGGQALTDLISAYAKSSHSAYGELFIEAEGKFVSTTPGGSADSHYAGEFQISRLVRHSADSQLMSECRKKGKR